MLKPWLQTTLVGSHLIKCSQYVTLKYLCPHQFFRLQSAKWLYNNFQRFCEHLPSNVFPRSSPSLQQSMAQVLTEQVNPGRYLLLLPLHLRKGKIWELRGNSVLQHCSHQAVMLQAGRAQRNDFSCFCCPRRRIYLACQNHSSEYGLSLLLKAEGPLQRGYKPQLPWSHSGGHATPREPPSATESEDTESGPQQGLLLAGNDAFQPKRQKKARSWASCSKFGLCGY